MTVPHISLALFTKVTRSEVTTLLHNANINKRWIRTKKTAYHEKLSRISLLLSVSNLYVN